MRSLISFRNRWAGTIQDVCAGCAIAFLIAVAALVLP